MISKIRIFEGINSRCMNRRFIVPVLFGLLFAVTSWGQNQDFITLCGYVTDRATSAPLYYASVKLKGTSLSIVSNSDGYFSLKVPETTSMEADVLISFLGYKSESVKVSAFRGCTPDKPLRIGLEQTFLSLDPATVLSLDPMMLVQSAYFKVKENYPLSRVGMTAFYREMVRKGTSKYLSLNEAIIDIDKSPYAGFSPDKVGIYKGRGSIDYDSSDTLFVKYQGGIITAMNLDQVKNPLAGTYLEDAMKVYDFYMDGMESYDGYSFYKVGFRPKKNEEALLYKGIIYIETENLAIGRVEMEMELDGREEEAAHLLVVKFPPNSSMYVNSARYIVNYKCFDGLWYYDYCRVDLNFTTKKHNSMFKRHFSVTGEMAVTDHHEGSIAIEPAERVKFKDILSDKVADFADENFWEDYNIIEPDQSIGTIIQKIIRKLKRR